MKRYDGQTETENMARKEAATSFAPEIRWHEPMKKARGEELLKNMATAAALLLCVIALRNGALPAANDLSDTVLAAATDDSLLNDRLGKLSFVNALFPEAVLVFGETSFDVLEMPIEATEMVHAWKEEEPYTAWTAESTCVFAALSGEVAGVYHGVNEELLVQIANEFGMTCTVGNLRAVNVDTGDCVEQGELIGWIEAGDYCSFEVQRAGVSIDPATMLEDACDEY